MPRSCRNDSGQDMQHNPHGQERKQGKNREAVMEEDDKLSRMRAWARQREGYNWGSANGSLQHRERSGSFAKDRLVDPSDHYIPARLWA